MKKYLMSLTAAVAITASTGHAEETAVTNFETGQQLYNMCTVYRDGLDACAYYIQGSIDQIVAYSFTMKTNSVCLPAYIQTAQITKLVVQELYNNPEYLKYTAAYAVLFAVGRAFPCAKS